MSGFWSDGIFLLSLGWAYGWVSDSLLRYDFETLPKACVEFMYELRVVMHTYLAFVPILLLSWLLYLVS